MTKLLRSTLAALLLVVAVPALANNFRAADAVYVPAAGKVVGGAIFSTSVSIINVSSDAIEVDVAYLPTQQDNRDRTNSENLTRVATLGVNEAVSFDDFFVEVLNSNSAFGQLLFFACRAGGDCVNNDSDFRDIIVEARIYAENEGVAGTTGQLFSGLPWYSYISRTSASELLDSARIIGIEVSDAFRSNYGLANASQFSSTTIRVELWRNDGTRFGTVNKQLAPLSHLQEGITSAFPGFSGKGYLVVTQVDVTPTNPDDPDVGDGVPGFFAYGSVLDNLTDDPTTLEAAFPVPINLAVYDPQDPAKSGTTTVRRPFTRR